MINSGLDSIIGGLMEKLRKDLDVDEAITAEAEKAFFTLNQGQSLGSSVFKTVLTNLARMERNKTADAKWRQKMLYFLH